jgi:hypothetical protein
MKKNKWLAITIFSAKNNWSSLLKNGIQPLLSMLFDNNEIISFYIQFNDINSEHIRLALLAPGNLTHKVASKTNVYFENLFKDIEGSPVSNNGASIGIFVPYLKNTVHYDLYSTSMLPLFGDLLALQQKLCQSMLDVFTEDVIDNDLIETFCLYLLFSCYKIVPESERLFYAREQETLNDFFDDGNNDVLTSVNDIYNHVMNPSAENTLEWLNKWEHVFKKMYAAACDKGQGLTCFNTTVNLIHRQLGLSKLPIKFLNRLVLKTLPE